MNIILSCRRKGVLILIRILFESTRRKPRRYLAVTARRLPAAVAVSFASQVLGRGADAVARGAARCASHVLDPGSQAGA
jgi:hypothetical protein